MRRTIGQSLRIGVAGHAVSLVRVSRWRGEPFTVLAEHAFAPSAAHPFDAIANALRALLGEQDVGGWPASIVLADELTRMWRVTPPPGATRLDDMEAAAGLRFQSLYGERLDDMEAAAGLRFQSLYGEAPSAWKISADWNATEPFFAAAMPRALLAVLELVAREFKLSIVGVEPHFVSAWNRWRRGMKQRAWFGLLHDNLLTLAAIDTIAGKGKGVQAMRAIRALPVPPGADAAWLTQTLKREALLLDMPPPELLQLCGAASASAAGAAAWTRSAGNASQIPCEALDQAQQAGGAGLSMAALLARGGSLA